MIDFYLPKEYKDKIVHCKRQKYDVYVGRPSIFGNPFKIGKDGDRLEVIIKFENYFLYKINTDEQFKRAIDKLKGKVLGCYCAPKDCHARIIVDYLEGVYKNE
jgi:hypothetical protein